MAQARAADAETPAAEIFAFGPATLVRIHGRHCILWSGTEINPGAE
jgi:hypothetical protein